MIKPMVMAVLVGVAGVGLVGCSNGGRVVTEEAIFREFPGAVRASDGVVEVVVIPEGGRVISVSLVGDGGEGGSERVRERQSERVGDGGRDEGPGNFLWVNPEIGKPGMVSTEASRWNNYGGDKTWGWPQGEWKGMFGYEWPPAVGFDQAKFRLTGIRGGVRMEGPVMEREGVRVVREVRLMGGGRLADGRRLGRVRVYSRIEAVGSGGTLKGEVGVWHVTQLPWPEEVRVEGVKGGEGAGWELMNDKTAWAGARQEGDVVVLPGDAGGGAKVGADGARLVWKGRDGREVRQWVVGGGGSAGRLLAREQLQVYRGERTGKAGDYVELEVTGPRVEVRAGRPAELVVEWEVVGGR